MAWAQQDPMTINITNLHGFVNDRNVNFPVQDSSQIELELHSKNGRLSDGSECDPFIQNHLEELILHAFLPRKTPLTLQDNLDEIEECMLHLAHITLTNLRLPQIEKVEGMLENWKRIQVKASSILEEFMEEFKSSMEQLEIGESTVIYVRKQNCNILFTKLEGHFMRCMTYRSSLPNETVMSTIGSLQVTFPETDDVTLNQDLLLSSGFASQLFELCTTTFEMARRDKGGATDMEPRNVVEPFLVSDWIIGQLLPANHPVPNVTVTKKIRDEVRCQPSAAAIPFRRSGMWTSIKIAIALKIREVVKSEENAQILYKVIMLHLLANLGMYYCQQNQVRFDLVSQILAKLGRRAVKLQKLKADQNEEFNELTQPLSSAKLNCLQHVLQVSTDLRNKATNLWNKQLSENSPTTADRSSVKRILRTPAELSSDLRHEIAFLDKLVQHRTQSQPSLDTTDKGLSSIQLVALKRYKTLESCLQASSGSTDFEKKVWLQDTEILIKTCLEETTTNETINNIFLKYICTASSFYNSQSDPVGFSQMLLCLLKLVQELDKFATREHSLLLEYESGITAKDFDMTLLPHLDDMNLLEEVLDYFRVRDKNAKYPAILKSKLVDHNTFSVRYAMSNPAMKTLRASIRAETEKRVQEKYEEVDRTRERCKDLQRQISWNKRCSCKPSWNKKGDCDYCKLESLRKSVSIYVRRLPREEYLEHAVIFEISVPKELTYLRDALAMLNFDILQNCNFNDSQPAVRWEHQMWRFPPDSWSMIVKMWSNTKASSPSNPDILTHNNWGFVLDNGMDCVYFRDPSRGVRPTKADPKDSSAFHIRNTCNAEMKLYENLQYTLADTTHTQNKVIASSYSCHQDLTVAEFISFGSIRSGHRIQIRNLFRSISNRTLSLEKEPVVALILQTLWHLGPTDEDGVRDSHADFLENDAFAREFLVLLENVVDNNEQNYSSPNILLVVIVAAVRIMELNDNCRQEGYELLHKCRQLQNKWAERLEKYISEELSKSSSENLKSLKMLLLKSTICSAFTFKTSSSLLDSVAQQPDDILHWLHTISRMHELISEKHAETLSPFAKFLLMTARSVPFQLECSSLFSHTIKMSDCLHSFATKKWNKANDCTLQESWSKHENHPNIFVGKYKEKEASTEYTLTFDFHQGQFLVDGYPSSSLPPQIIGHKLYQLYFSGITFKIQRDSKTFRTVDPFHENHYEFVMTSSENPDLIIREIDAKQNTFELLDPENFTDVVAPTFRNNYTHWLNLQKETVYFKQRPAEDSHYGLPPEFTLTKIDSMWLFKNMKTEKYLLSINSEGFDQISAALSRVEERPDVNAVIDETTGQVSALLPRYQLSFHLNDEGHLCSVEYPDYKIAEVQALGTLVGLQQGILMEKVIKGTDKAIILTKQLALIPHGNIEIMSSLQHQTTRIKLSTLRSPKFFAYEVDSVLNRLVGGKNKAAWFYLAALHGATSSSLPEPFTGLTGTEMAMWILQSAMVWSGSPYDDESLQILKTIRAFSPERSYYVINQGRLELEVLSWPPGLPELAAFDGFDIVVDSLLRDSNQLSFLFPSFSKLELATTNPKDGRKKGKAQLRVRAYLRSLQFYNQDVAVKEDYMSKSYIDHIGNAGNPNSFQLRPNFFQQLLSVCQIRYVNDNIIHDAVLNSLRKCNLVSYLISDEPLEPPIETKSVVGISLGKLIEMNMRASRVASPLQICAKRSKQS